MFKTLRQIEDEYIAHVINSLRGHRAGAYRVLGLSERTLRYRVARIKKERPDLDINDSEFNGGGSNLKYTKEVLDQHYKIFIECRFNIAMAMRKLNMDAKNTYQAFHRLKERGYKMPTFWGGISPTEKRKVVDAFMKENNLSSVK
jgi:hypothetical protein